MPTKYAGAPVLPQEMAFRESIAGRWSWFWYGTSNLVFTGPSPAAQNPQIQIDAGSDFLAMELMAFNDRSAIVVSGAALGDFFLLDIQDSAASRNYNAPSMHSQLICGTATDPHYFQVPILFRASASIALQVQVINTGAVTHNIRIAFGGVKIYRNVR